MSKLVPKLQTFDTLPLSSLIRSEKNVASKQNLRLLEGISEVNKKPVQDNCLLLKSRTSVFESESFLQLVNIEKFHDEAEDVPFIYKLQHCWVVLTEFDRISDEFIRAVKPKPSQTCDENNNPVYEIKLEQIEKTVCRFEHIFHIFRDLVSLNHLLQRFEPTEKSQYLKEDDLTPVMRPQLGLVRSKCETLKAIQLEQQKPWRLNLKDEILAKREQRKNSEEVLKDVDEVVKKCQVYPRLVTCSDIQRLEMSLQTLGEFYSEDNQGPSFHEVIAQETYTLLESTIQNLTFESMFNIDERKSEPLFEDSLCQFGERFHRIEKILEAYLNCLHCFPLKFPQKINTMQRFSSLQDKAVIKQALVCQLVECLHEFKDFMMIHKTEFNQNKDSETLSGSMPFHARKLAWIKELIERIERPMQVFQFCRHVFSDDTSRQVFMDNVKIYNLLMLRFTEYETFVLQDLKQQLIKYLPIIKQPILTPTLELNFPDEAVSIIRNARYLEQLGYEMENEFILNECLLNLPKFGEYRNKVDDCLAQYHDLVSQFRELAPVGNSDTLVELWRFSSLGQSLLMEFYPATNSITWNHANIDSFVIKVCHSLEESRNRIKLLKPLMEDQIKCTLAELRQFVLFEEDQILHTNWESSKLVNYCSNLLVEFQNYTRCKLGRLEGLLQTFLENLLGFEFSCKDYQIWNKKALELLTGVKQEVISSSSITLNHSTTSKKMKKFLLSKPMHDSIMTQINSNLQDRIVRFLTDFHYTVKSALHHSYIRSLISLLTKLSPAQVNLVQKDLLRQQWLPSNCEQAADISSRYQDFDEYIEKVGQTLFSELTIEFNAGFENLPPINFQPDIYSHNNNNMRIKFHFTARFLSPELTIEPACESATFAIRALRDKMVTAYKGLAFYENEILKEEESKTETLLLNLVGTSLADLDETIDKLLIQYFPQSMNILWKESPREKLRYLASECHIETSIEEFIPNAGINLSLKRPNISEEQRNMRQTWKIFSESLKKEIQTILALEGQLDTIPAEEVGAGFGGFVVLDMSPAKCVLANYARMWKDFLSQPLQLNGKRLLTVAVDYTSLVEGRLNYVQKAISSDPLLTSDHPIEGPDLIETRSSTRRESIASSIDDQGLKLLEFLTKFVQYLEEIEHRDYEIDFIYRPIEMTYTDLDLYEVEYSRKEHIQLLELRTRWENVMKNWQKLSRVLLVRKKSLFLQELDRETKSFTVEVVQYRNAFEAEGRAVVGLNPTEASNRLTQFEQLQTAHENKFQVLISVARLFGAKLKQFPELCETANVSYNSCSTKFFLRS
ncbi:hypothetical protein Ciccas_000067 [Cichlidogyrus casuarinus]|uniref:Dynein heavy chain tail domain-containing protein n=1 Tax=Cichlidogyrus casuarinus TaxID=1844966 RepID=A0ABD2QNY4_9PLAT